MKIPAYHVDAFAGPGFSGNPAMVCPLDRWLDDEMLLLIARKNDLPVTAFLVADHDQYELRWFTSTTELNLCGHGTLAAAAVVFDSMDRQSMAFKTKGGTFKVVQEGSRIGLDFPVLEATPCPKRPEDLVRALGREPREILTAPSQKYLAVYEEEAEISAIAPDMELLKEFEGLGTIVTAKGESSDFVSRYFAPRIGIPEDAATGSTHCTLAPYWSREFGKRKLHALQLSQRGGELWCEDLEDRVRISARALRRAESVVSV